MINSCQVLEQTWKNANFLTTFVKVCVDPDKKISRFASILTTHNVSQVKYSTVQYSTVQYSTVQYSTVQYSTVQYSTRVPDTWCCSQLFSVTSLLSFGAQVGGVKEEEEEKKLPYCWLMLLRLPGVSKNTEFKL